MIDVNEVRIKKINKGELLGYASVLIDDSFVIDGISLYEKNNNRYILMPVNYKKMNSGRNIARRNVNIMNVAFPISNEVRMKLLNAISEKYDEQ